VFPRWVGFTGVGRGRIREEVAACVCCDRRVRRARD
jgi:hypothetical protein